MNIVRALDVALPELHAQRKLQLLPKVERSLIAREHLEGGLPTFIVMKPKADCYYRLTPDEWTALQLFNGQRSCSEIAEQFQEETGKVCSEDDIRMFARSLADTSLVERARVDANVTLSEELKKQREKRRTRKWGDLSEVTILSYDPNEFLNKTYPYVRFFYSTWFNLVAIVMMGIMTAIFITHWSEIWHDTFEYYMVTNKTFVDFMEVWILFTMAAFFHESAHGMTCKHFGAGVHSQGFLLMYLLPCFFNDSSEVWVYGGRWERIVTAIAGIWIELIFCSVVTLVWWATTPGMWIHDIAYKLILITGIGVVILNVNPLVRLDGYFIFTELIGIGDLKERSTFYVSSWVKKHLFRLPVEVEPLPSRRKLLFVTYALLSGAYSYLLLFAVVQLLYRVALKYSPEWAWVLALWLTYKIFRSRIKAFGRFLKVVYLDKKERLRMWLTPGRLVTVSAGVLAILFALLWPDFVQGRFVIEPSQRAVIRAEVPGQVNQVMAREGELVSAGSPLVQLRNLSLESEAARNSADLRLASARATEAQLRYAAFGVAERERQRLAERNRVLNDQVAKLNVTSPLAGVVVTPRFQDLLGTELQAGAEVAEVDNLATVLARIYVPEVALRDVRPGARAQLRLDSSFGVISGSVAAIAPAPALLPDGLIEQAKAYEGFRQPQYYVATVVLKGGGSLRAGMSGTGKIFVQRRSLAGYVWRSLRDAVERKFW
ncbi:MAG TPA: HlyD family efflux transporter periplasmic adaptor subunit [Terriglobales bacterium]|jgi:putative peptide zinc metalloprotease protein|nr:HlyD family efflux transporter periplasmic adaptor subunit [Terriglobales bacterium]